MKLDRKKNAIRGIFAGSINKVIAMLLPFIMRTIILYSLGTQYLGLSSLFTSVINLFCLTELGIGSAMVFSMYKPIAEDDTKTICALLNLYRKLYRTIGIVITIIGIAFIPFLQYSIKGDIPSDINIYVLYLIYLTNTVITYFLFSYKNSLLDAFQRKDIDLNVNTILTFLEYTIQIILILITKNYYLYVIVFPIFTIIGNLIRAYIVSKKFPQYKCYGKISKDLKHDIFTKVGALSIHKIGNVISSSSTTIIVSSYIGLTSVAIYGNYNYIIISLISITNIIFTSLTAGIANKMVLESTKSNENTFNNLFFITMWLNILFTTCIICLSQNFMILWVGKNLLLPDFTVFFFALTFNLQLLRKVVLTYHDAAGLWKQDRFKPVIGAVLNITIGIILTKYIGILGVIISLSASLILIEIPWETNVLYKYYFRKTSTNYYKKIMEYTCIGIVIYIISYFICSLLSNNIFSFILKIIIAFTIPNIILLFTYHNKKEFSYVLSLIRKK